MGIIQTLNEALSVKQLAAQFYTGYQQVSPGKTELIPHKFATQIGSRYNNAITDVFTGGDHRTSVLANVLASIYTETYRTKKELFDLYRSVKDLDQASVIIEDLADDAFNSPDSEYPFTIKVKGDVYDKKEIELNLQEFIKKFDIYQLDRDITEDYLVYGEYYLSTIPKVGSGIVELYDNVEFENVFSIYKGCKLIQHIGMDKNSMYANSNVSGYAGQLKAIHADLLSHFILDSRKIKIVLPGFESSIYGVPETIRIGRGVLFNALNLLKKYQLLDMALTYKEVRNALMPILLGVTTGAFTTPDHMIEATKTIESFLQDGTAMSIDLDNDANSVQNLLQGSQSIKVAPIPGDKGELSRIDIGQGSNETEGLNNILNDTGNRIAMTAGGVTESEAGKSRLEILKSNSRRSKRLIDIQRGKADGWKNLLHKHLRYQHINIEAESLQVNYKSIPNADIFEEANGMVTLLSVVNDLQTFADSVKQSGAGYKVNPQKMVDAFNLYIGNRYPQMKDFLELDIAKEEFPGAVKAFGIDSKTQVGYNGEPEEQGVRVNTPSQSSTALTRMNKSFNGSSGKSDATGSV